MSRAHEQLRLAAEHDLEHLRRRQARWADECRPKLLRGKLRLDGARDSWWLKYGRRDIAAAELRLERIKAAGP